MSSEQVVPVGVADEEAAMHADGADAAGHDPIYVYAVMQDVDLGALPARGVDPLRPVETLAVAGLQAVVSRVRFEHFNPEVVEAGLANMAWLEARVLAHQQVMEALVRTDLPVIPMRFCTLYRSDEAVARSFNRYAVELADELQRLDGKQEWGLKQTVDLQPLQRAIYEGHAALGGTVDPEIERLRRQVASMSQGAAFLLRKKLQGLVAERAQDTAFAIGDVCHARLSAQAIDAITVALPEDRPEVCLNGAYLVQREGYAAFYAVLEELAEQYAAVGIRYELSGPWPAHHFLRLTLDGPEASG